MMREIGILMSNAAKPPINPPRTQELSVFAKIRTTADATIRTNASAAILMNTFHFLLFHNTTRFWNTLTYFTVNLSVEYSRKRENPQGVVTAQEVIDVSTHTDDKERDNWKLPISLSPIDVDHHVAG